jgi:hypothetical protein
MNVKPTIYKIVRIGSILCFFFIILTFTATIAVAASVTLRWAGNKPTPQGYRVFARKGGQAYNYSKPSWQGAATKCTINNLQNQTEYFFVVRAFNGKLESANSIEVHYNPLAVTTQTSVFTNKISTTGQKPYGGTPQRVPGTIEAEDYDTGGEGIAYHDTTAGNKGGKYRTDGVDIRSGNSSIGFYTSDNATGEWLEYTVKVANSGKYSLDLYVATANSGRKMRVQLDGKDLAGPISIPNTGGNDKWETVMTTIQLSAGEHVLRVVFDRGGLKFNWMDISPIGATTKGSTTGQKPYGGTPRRVPGTIEAEDYDTGGEGVAYHDTTSGNKGGKYRTDDVDITSSGKSSNGFFTKYNDTDEWLEYTINAAYAGSYKLDFSVATPKSGRKLRVKLDGVYVTNPIKVPNTGAWDAWQTVRAKANLKAGKHVLRVEILQGGLNFDWIDIY